MAARGVSPTEGEMTTTRFVFTELHASDVHKARAFYAALLGWEYREVLGVADYALIHSSGATFGAVAAAKPGASSWLAYVGVDDVEAATARARALGATIEVECRVFGRFGTLSVIIDPVGARVGLWQEASRKA